MVAREPFTCVFAALRGLHLDNVQTFRPAKAASTRFSQHSKRDMLPRMIMHRDWLAADDARVLLQQQGYELFREWDVVLCPVAPTTAFPHDHSSPIKSRRIRIDGKPYLYLDAQVLWAELATTSGLPATVAPIDRSESGLPIGVQIIGPYLKSGLISPRIFRPDANKLGVRKLLND